MGDAARRELEMRVERTSVGRDGCLGGMPRGSTAKSLWRRRWCSAPPARPPSAGLDVDGSRGARAMGSRVFRRMIAASRGASFTTGKHGGTREAFADLSIARRPTACTQECMQSSGGRRALTRPRAVAAASRTVATGTIVTILSTEHKSARRSTAGLCWWIAFGRSGRAVFRRRFFASPRVPRSSGDVLGRWI